MMKRPELRERDFESFFRVPFVCYGDATAYVSPMKSDLRRYLDEARNPLFRGHGDFTFFTLHQDRRPVGRIVAHVHHDSNRIHGLRRSYFGFFDCIDDIEVARTLLAAAEEWGRRRGYDELAGNFNLTAVQQLGVVIEGFENRPYTDMQFNPPHIPRLLEACGFEPFFPMSTFELPLGGFDPAVLLGPKQRALFADPAFRFERLTRRDFKRLMADTRRVLSESFAQNPMFVPLTEAEFLFQAGEMMWIVDERISSIVYHDGEPAGVCVCIPDLNPFLRDTRSRIRLGTPWYFLRHRLRRRRALIIFVAVRPGLQNGGLTGAMLYKITTALKQARYERLGVTWISDLNTASLRQIEKLGACKLHRLCLFRKPIPSGA
jgi:GNAT superfamily N-acetyltransferase